jgi:adenosine deaminase
MDLSGLFNDDGSYKFTDFWHFLKVYEAATTTLQSPEDFHALTLAVLEESAKSGVIYTECFLAPDFCGNRDLSAWREYLHAIEEAAAIAEATMGITMRGIVTAVRHNGPDKARQTALCAAETAGHFVTGFGLAGDEKVMSPKDFTYAFDMAREAGLRLTAHAGEWGGPQSVRDAIADLKVERIGHGARAIEDMALVESIAESGIVLELCPGSNVALGIFPSFRKHPIGEMYDRGVKVTISTDDPPFFHTTMEREYRNLHDAFDWDDRVFAKIARTALDAAFCDADTKTRLLKTLEAADA